MTPSRLLVFLLLAASVAAQRLNFGSCPDVEPLYDFDPEKFEGEWIELERSFYLMESAAACTSLNFTTVENATSASLKIFYISAWRNAKTSAKYRVSWEDSEPGKIKLLRQTSLPDFLDRLAPGSGSYIVLDTDYTSFALIYSCTSFRFLHADFVWILSRGEEIPADVRAKIYSKLDLYGIDRERVLASPRSTC